MNERPRFWRWYRSMPILAMLLVAVVCLAWEELPATILRRFVYPVRYQAEIIDSSNRYGVDSRLVCAIVKCESNWKESVQSDAGAIGLMQLMPATSAELAEQDVVDASRYDPANLTDAATNIEYGCAYLSQLQQQRASTDEVIAAYNAGPGSVEEWLSEGGDIADVISFPETALYLTRVNDTYDHYQQLYDETLSER